MLHFPSRFLHVKRTYSTATKKSCNKCSWLWRLVRQDSRKLLKKIEERSFFFETGNTSATYRSVLQTQFFNNILFFSFSSEFSSCFFFNKWIWLIRTSNLWLLEVDLVASCLWSAAGGWEGWVNWHSWDWWVQLQTFPVCFGLQSCLWSLTCWSPVPFLP